MEKEKTVLQIRIEKDLKEQFDQLCDQKCINKSNLIRKFITEWIEQNKK